MKPRLLYVSPFWPQRSGISEYSECLVWGLKEYFDITLLTKDKNIENRKIKDAFEVQEYKSYVDYSQYDFIIYNFGNSPDNHDYMYGMLEKYPGYVILHDFSLYYLTLLRYRDMNCLFQKVYEMHGTEGIVCIKDSIKEKGENDLILHKHLPPLLPLNNEVLKNAKGMIVHSNYVRDKIREVNTEVPVHKIELVDCMPEVKLHDRDFLRMKYGFGEDTFIVGAVGMIAPSKQNEITCKAVELYNNSHEKKIKYVMIGEGDYVDTYISEHIKKTGFLENEDFFNAVKSCNVIFNLRNPYNGESSATLMQCMLMGKHCVVTEQGWFEELPDEAVKKVPVDVTEAELAKLLEEAVNWESQNEAGASFVKEKCNSKAVAKSIADFLNSI